MIGALLRHRRWHRPLWLVVLGLGLATYFGYHATGGPVGVGRAVGTAIRTSFLVVVPTNLLLSYLFWGGAGTVSITG